ncbi:APC family permease [Rhodoplanes sp. TEM]|uniref:APC family permease n=1 Tax=Rhodoplanes tepidamans TaxID=200616 RepID=A0ABT5J9R3_RHOTP|nr:MULTISPECIES: APC family permease [Rhodoplanes]MDC7786400.1 APC family permease [Rhodoplanes tepidamans]MDC7983613.1 APC family permease [Rhodoplanes sp. TEM]MDQ0354145.1 amino acid transporter [Rhodoplanes tepidamans]
MPPSSLPALLLGRPLANEEHAGRKVGLATGVPTVGLGAFGSPAYGPESALLVLAPLGAVGLAVFAAVQGAVVLVLLLLWLTFRRALAAFPGNGGAYTIARDTLGPAGGLLAAAVLMLDYVLNVAVGISAGVAALVSAVPALAPYRLTLCLAVLALLTVINMRGALDAGRLFAVPVYGFLAAFAVVIAAGVGLALVGPPAAAPAPAPVADEAGGWTVVLLAYAVGCTAMTGIEAVGNSIDTFRDPAVRTARRALAMVVVVLAVFLVALAVLVPAFGIVAMPQTATDYRSVLAQLAAATIGQGALYFVCMGTLLCVLVLSAHTSFVGLPAFFRLVAADGWLPRPFAVLGRRLVLTVGVLFLAACAGALLILFAGVTDRLVPLFAAAALTVFLLIQLGMAVHDLRVRRRVARERAAARRGAAFNLAVDVAGGLATAIALVITIVAWFLAGVWIVLLVVPALMGLLVAVRRYYAAVDRALSSPAPLDLADLRPPVVLVPTEDLSRLSDRALTFALAISPDVIAVHLAALEGPGSEDKERSLRESWATDVEAPARAAGREPPRLVTLRTPYRHVYAPLLQLIDGLADRDPGRRIAVLTPEVVKQHWWQYPLHTLRARRMRAGLVAYGGSRVVVMSMPWYLDEPDPARAARETTPAPSPGIAPVA